jgi:Flp pilus assembly protein TadD
LYGCATTEAPEQEAAQVAIQEDAGFTITEDVRISNDVRFEYEQALLKLEQGQYEQGIELLESVTSAAPDLSAPRIDLGIAYHQVGDLDAAEKNLLMALELNGQHPLAHNELGIVYRKKGQFADARQSYEASLNIFPGFHYARRNLAVLCDLYLADLECALENYEAYMATVPSDKEVTMWIADIRNRTGQ